MAYAEVTVIVDGALDKTREFDPDEENREDPEISMDAYINKVGDEAGRDGIPTEVYILIHDHPHECECEHTHEQHVDGGPAVQEGNSVFVPADPCGVDGCDCEGYSEAECACSQYVTDHRPHYSWNMDA